MYERIDIREFLLKTADSPYLTGRILSGADQVKASELASALALCNGFNAFYIFNQQVAMGVYDGRSYSDDIFETVVLRGPTPKFYAIETQTQFFFEAHWTGGGIVSGPLQSYAVVDSLDRIVELQPIDIRLYQRQHRGEVYDFVEQLRFSSPGQAWLLTRSLASPAFLKLSN